MQANKKVIFVGSFKSNTSDGGMGGQMFASHSLIGASEMSDVDFIKIDTTAISIPAPPIYRRIPHLCKRIFRYLRALITNRVDACLIFSSVGLSFIEKGIMVLIANLFGVKTIFAPRSGLIIDSVQKSIMMKWFVTLIIRKADHILCQGNSWKIFYQELSQSSQEKFVVIQNWIDIDNYEIDKSPRTSDDDELNILYMGWLEPYKGVFDLLEAITLLSVEVHFNVLIFGSGSVKDELQKKINSKNLQDKVILKGWADFKTKVTAFKEADIFVLPSHREGFPNVLLEAMASQLPVIATDVGGIGDLIDDGKNGLLVNPSQPDELAEAMMKLLTNPILREEMAMSARNSVINNNAISTASRKLRKLF